MPQLGEKIRSLRLQLGLTQEQLVEGIAQKSTLSQIESGKAPPSVELLLQIAQRLGVGIDSLLSDVTWNRKPMDLYKIANTLYSNGSYSAALPFWLQWQELQPESMENPEILYKIGICHAERGDLTQAVACFERSQQLAALNGDCRIRYVSLKQLGDLYFKHSQFNLSIHYWQRALERKPETSDKDSEPLWRLYNRIGGAYFQLGEYANAIDYYFEGLKWIRGEAFVSERAVTLLNVAVSLKQLGQYTRAGEMFHELRKDEKELEPLLYTFVQFHYSVYLAATSRLKEAETLLWEVRQRFLAMNENGCVDQVDNELAEVYRQMGDRVQACRILQELISRLPENHKEYPLAIMTYGLLHRDEGNLEQAIVYLQQALRLFEEQGRIDQVRKIQESIADCLAEKRE